MKKLLGLLAILPTLTFGQTYWTNIQVVPSPLNLVDTFILGVTNGTPTNELMTAQGVLNWIGSNFGNLNTNGVQVLSEGSVGASFNSQNYTLIGNTWGSPPVTTFTAVYQNQNNPLYYVIVDLSHSFFGAGTNSVAGFSNDLATLPAFPAYYNDSTTIIGPGGHWQPGPFNAGLAHPGVYPPPLVTYANPQNELINASNVNTFHLQGYRIDAAQGFVSEGFLIATNISARGQFNGMGKGITNIPLSGLITNGATGAALTEPGVYLGISNGVVVLTNIPSNTMLVFTNHDSGVNLTASGTFATNLFIFTTPTGNTNLWELTVSSPWVNVNSSYSVTAQVAVTPDGTPAASPWTETLWTDAADSTFPVNTPLIIRIAPNTTVTFSITGSGAGSISMRGRTTATAWIIDPQ